MYHLMRATLTVVLASVASASGIVAHDEWFGCAEFITSEIDDEPVAGELCGGSETLYGITHGRVERREVIGYYRLTNGEIIHLDCDTYEEVAN
jgi:hypothetical protein